MSQMTSMNIDESQESNFQEFQAPPSDEFSPDLNEQAQDDLEGDEASKKKDKQLSPMMEAFLKELEETKELDLKLQKTIDFMENSLSQHGTPNFKNFWDARAICLQLFKENVSPIIRGHLWTRYTELSKEARRLKEILDEQTAFAVEQIEIAINALEKDVEHYQEYLDKSSDFDFQVQSETLKERMSFYQRMQKELNLLNTQASRINALRKELIKTEMRIRQKNKFFQRLSAAGDKVFPRRKDLIRDISQQFTTDIEQFIEQNFNQGSIEDSLFFLREEIKSLQGMAKLLTLNTHAFTQTRMRLSECWDKIKVLEKERKKVRAQQKAVFKQNFDEAYQKIQDLTNEFNAGTLSLSDANKRLEEILSFMKGVELGREEIKILRDEITKAKRPLLDKMRKEEDERHQAEFEREQARKQRVEELKQEIEQFQQSLADLSLDELNQQRDLLTDKIAKSGLNKAEKQEIERLMKRLKNAISDAISDQKEKALLNLSEDDRQTIQQLKEILEQRKERCNEIKNQIKNLKKSRGLSGLDIEQAMNLHAQLNTENERLEKMQQGIEEIEQKIIELESQSN